MPTVGPGARPDIRDLTPVRARPARYGRPIRSSSPQTYWAVRVSRKPDSGWRMM